MRASWGGAGTVMFITGQVFGFVYAPGQGLGFRHNKQLKSKELILARPLRCKVHDYATIFF
jgi:hypothetical protein